MNDDALEKLRERIDEIDAQLLDLFNQRASCAVDVAEVKRKLDEADDGSIDFFRPDREALKRVATNELNEASNASVVVAGNDVFVRTDQALWCFADPAKN